MAGERHVDYEIAEVEDGRLTEPIDFTVSRRSYCTSIELRMPEGVGHHTFANPILAEPGDVVRLYPREETES